jgi:hypothetical protein
MALLFMDGFDHYATADVTEKWTSVSDASHPVIGAYGRTGTQGLLLSGANQIGSVVMTVLGGVDEAIVGFAFKLASGAPSGAALWAFGSANAWECGVRLNADLTLQPVRCATNFQPGAPNFLTGIGVATTAALQVGVWAYIEIQMKVSATVGTCTIRINGNGVTAQTGLNTLGAVAALTRIGIGGLATSAGACHYDDLVMMDLSGSLNNAFIGDCRVVTLLPQTDAVAAGSNANFTCSTGTDHGALVDEAAPNDDTDHVFSSALNHVDTWNYPALGYTGTIKGVQMSLSAKKTDSGTRAIAAVTRPVATNRVHATNHYIGTSYAYWKSIWEVNPEDSAAWEVADVDGAEFGVKVMV